MTEHTLSRTPLDPDEAMNSALRAEQRALAAIKECEGEAASLIDSAQQRARSIIERTDQRIRDLHLRCIQATSDRLDAMVEDDSREAEQAVQQESAARALESAVERLAARLTGQTSEG
jgi:vacuolar-type H+-ATPase subunit H